jgi:hypothetical protein
VVIEGYKQKLYTQLLEKSASEVLCATSAAWNVNVMAGAGVVTMNLGVKNHYMEDIVTRKKAFKYLMITEPSVWP